MKLKDVIKDVIREDTRFQTEALNPRRYSELKGHAKYLNNSSRQLMRFISQQDDKKVIDEIDYILSKAKLLKEIHTDKRYD